MIKKALFTVIALGLTTVVLFGRDATSYVGTTYHRLTSSVKESVPIEFQIDRARAMVRDLEPEIRRSMHVIAKEEVALEQLNEQIAATRRRRPRRTRTRFCACRPIWDRTRTSTTMRAAPTLPTKSSKT